MKLLGRWGKPPDSEDGHRRVLPFRGASNFRDLGGYVTAEGRQIKWGVLYRSGNLSKMTKSDLKRFQRLNIHTLVDFRSDVEKEQDPNRLPQGHHIRLLSLPILDETTAKIVREVKRRIRDRDLDGFDPDAIVAKAYRQLAVDFAGEYGRFVRAVLEANGEPVLWHCTAGKDRAGLASAIILRLLGVPRQVAVQDYMLSAKYVKPWWRLLAFVWLVRGTRAARVLKSFMGVQESWIRAAFQTIDDRWGSFSNYQREALGLSLADVTQLRQSLLALP